MSRVEDWERTMFVLNLAQLASKRMHKTRFENSRKDFHKNTGGISSNNCTWNVGMKVSSASDVFFGWMKPLDLLFAQLMSVSKHYKVSVTKKLQKSPKCGNKHLQLLFIKIFLGIQIEFRQLFIVGSWALSVTQHFQIKHQWTKDFAFALILKLFGSIWHWKAWKKSPGLRRK